MGESEQKDMTRQEFVEAPVHFTGERHGLPEVMPEKFGERLEVYRERLGITKATLAKRSGIDVTYLHMLIHNDRSHPSLGVAYLLSVNLFLLPEEREDFIVRAGHNPEVVKVVEANLRKLFLHGSYHCNDVLS